MDVSNRTHSTRPRSRLYSDIPRADAPVIYTGAFPIFTARAGRRSICNICNERSIGFEEKKCVYIYIYIRFD